MIRDILIHPDPRLKKPCEPIAAVGAEISALASDMFETMYEAPGIGLAAPQIGVMKRLIVMDCIKDGPPEPIALLNPQVLWSSEDLGSYEEGCLSIPDQYAEVKRPSSVKVGWIDLDGVSQERLFTGLWATCVQHEIDHLNGKLFIDYLGPLKRQMITRKMEKLKRERARSGSDY
ncbi:MAG: peptide deformylase [Pseudomonadota bacterium]